MLILTPGPGLAAPGGGGGEEPTEDVGNNLATPVIWADVAGPVLRGDGSQTAALTVDNATTHVKEGNFDVFLQQQEGNNWQAENVTLAASGLADSTSGKLRVTYVDWGDNLSKDPSTTQKIRVETALLQDVSALTDAKPAAGATTGMTGYLMQKVGTASGQDEMWGVVATGGTGAWIATEQQRTEAFAYTGHACLTIERIDQAAVVAWDATDQAWTDAGDPVCIGEGADGPGSYGAEVTISGGITYGHVWDASALPSGLYRLTFSLKSESGVDLADAGFPPVVPEPEKTAVVTAEAEAEEGGGSSPAKNVPVIVPELNLSYLDVGLDYTRGKPTRPVNLTSTPGVESMALAWAAPVSSGASPLTAYVVRATRNDTGSTLTAEVPAGTLGHTFTGLAGGVAYTFAVKAVNASGASDETTVIATPLVKPPANPPAANTPVANTTPVAGTPPGQATKAVTVKASAVAGKSKVKVNVNPNMGKGYWRFQFEKKSGGTYRLLPKVYKTQGAAERLTVNLKKGTYRAVVLPKYGYAGATSKAVTLKR